MKAARADGDSRPFADIEAHYLIERELAWRLRSATREERRLLYAEMYADMYARVPRHPSLAARRSPAVAEARARHELRFVSPYLDSMSDFVEIGPGDYSLARLVAPRVHTYTGLSIDPDAPVGFPRRGFRVVTYDGTVLPLPDNSADIVYSSHLLEQIHPDDAMEHLTQIKRVLRPGGRFLCVTPNRLQGSHDVSAHFDNEPTCFLLHEYTVTELSQMRRAAGPRCAATRVGVLVGYLPVPVAGIRAVEAVLERLPRR